MALLSKLASLLRPTAASAGTAGACETCPEGLPDEDPAFAAAVTALGAKLAKADGFDDPVEYAAFTEAFAPRPESERAVRRFYALARGTTAGFESYARKLADRYRACPNLLERVLQGLFHVAGADGAVTAREEAYLQRVSDLFGFSPLRFRRIRADHLGLPSGDPYAVLGVMPDVPDEEVQSAWKRALKEAHPDRAMARGLSEDLVAAASETAQALNAAFEAVMRERRAIQVGAAS